MRRALYLALFLFGLPLFAQTDIPVFQYVNSAPSGTCTGTPPIQVVYATGAFWGCVAGSWAQINGGSGGAQFPGTNGLVKNTSTTNAVTAVGSRDGTGDYQLPTTNSCTGNIACSPTGSVWNFTYSGGAGTGAVLTGGPYNDAGYSQSTAQTTVGPLAHKYTMPAGLSAAQLSAQFAAITNSCITLPNGDYSHFNTWTNAGSPANCVDDQRTDIPLFTWNVKKSAAQCDGQNDNATVTVGSPTLTITNGAYLLKSSDAGDPSTHAGAKWIEMVGLVGGVPTRFDAQIIAVTDGTHATLGANAPFSATGYSVTIGHDDTAAFMAAINLWQGSNMEITLPATPSAQFCWTDTIPLQGQSMGGQGRGATGWVGKAGKTVLAANDPTNGGFIGNGLHQKIHDMTIAFDARIDATKAWSIDTNGTTVAQTPTYQPWGIGTYLANNPLGWGWIQNGQNGVMAMTNGSAVGCVPSGISLPPIGQPIFYPYQATNTPIFKATVSSYAGSCGSGSPVTLSTSWTPPTATANSPSGEWFTGTSVQTTQTIIPATGRVFPMTLNLSNPINPTYLNNPYPGSDTGDWNVAPFGTVIIDGEQCTYFGSSIYPANPTATPSITLTACAQNGTTAVVHNTAAYIAPLNPWKPNWPWPVFTTTGGSINGATSTPATAEYFPGLVAGNSAVSFPNYNGANWQGNEGLGYAHVYDLSLTSYPFFVFSGENAIGFQAQNSTACMYFVALPFRSHFNDISCTNAQMGYIEGAPAINQSTFFVGPFPTSDGNKWDNISAGVGFLSDFVGGGSNTYDNFTGFSQNGGPVGMSNYPAVGYSGAGTAWMWSGVYGDNFAPTGIGSGSKYLTAKNFYVELETGPTNGLIPAFRFGCENVCDWTVNPNSGGTAFVTGINNHFVDGGMPNQAPALPIVDFGYNTNFDNFAGTGGQVVSNTWGVGQYIKFGFGGHASANVATGGQGGFGPYGNTALGGTAPVLGQTAHAFEVFNDATPEVSADSAVIYPYEFNTSHAQESAPINAVVHDDTAPASHSYAECNIFVTSCTSFNFNSGGRIAIGPGQRIVPEKYTAHFAFETPLGAYSFPFQIKVTDGGAGCVTSTPLSITVTTAGSGWQTGQADVDFSSASGVGCILTTYIAQNPTSNNTARLAYLILTPKWSGVPLQVKTWSIGAACPVNGVILSSDPNYLYMCSNGVIQVIPFGGSLGISTLTGDVNASGTGAVSSTVVRIGGGTVLSTFSGLLQDNAGVVGQAQSYNLTGQGQVGTRYLSGVNTVACSSTPVFDLSLGDTQLLTLNCNVTSSSFINGPTSTATQLVRFIVCQDSTGGRTFNWPVSIQGTTPVTQVPSQCTSEFFNATSGIVIADNLNAANCISAASPAVCGQATIGEVAIPTGTNPTLQINTTAWQAHSQLIFTADTTKAADLGVTCNTTPASSSVEVTAAVAGTSVTITYAGTISTNPLCGTYTIRNP